MVSLEDFFWNRGRRKFGNTLVTFKMRCNDTLHFDLCLRTSVERKLKWINSNFFFGSSAHCQQKLFQQAQLQPCDDITIVFDVPQGSEDLTDVINTHKEYIEDSVKQPLVPNSHSPNLPLIISEKTEVCCMVFEFESFKRISLFLVQLGEKSLKQYQRGHA